MVWFYRSQERLGVWSDLEDWMILLREGTCHSFHSRRSTLLATGGMGKGAGVENKSGKKLTNCLGDKTCLRGRK